ncbi:MAG: chemotaxis protein, partial [Lysobacter sp.]
MTSDALTVVLLARAGTARDRLREAVQSAGADCVLEADPLELEPDALDASPAKVVLVALDPQSEDALERFDELLADPGREVIYEEASLAASREGWDLARWQRHLVAKIQRNGDVLPPGTEQEDSGAAAHGSGSEPATEVNPFDPVAAEMSLEPTVSVAAFEPGDVADGLDLSLAIEPAAADEAQSDSLAADGSHVADAEPTATGGFGVLSLDDGDGDGESVSAAAGETSQAKDRFARDISELEQRISGLSLVDDSP